MTIAVIGEALVDLVWRTGTDHLTPHPGGSPANVALGLHRLGQPVTLLTCWGDDPPGTLIGSHLATTGLAVTRIPSASGRSTVALAHLNPDTGSASYDFLPAWDPIDLPLDPDVRVLHTGSLAAVVEPGAAKVLDACRRLHGRPGGAVAVDLNVRPAVLPDRTAYRTALTRLVHVADVVKASNEDLAWLYPDLTPQQSAQALLGHGPSLVVVTQGRHGAFAITADHHITVGARNVEVIDTIGAGDAFQASLLDALWQPDGVRIPATPDELQALLQQCTTAGAIACTRAGAQPPTRHEIDAALNICVC